MRWFVQIARKPPTTIVDVGCDNGVLTCFYALLFPESIVVGVDLHAEAVKCGTKLARMLKLVNVQFEQASIGEFVGTHNRGFADLVTLTAIGEELEPDDATLPDAIDRLLSGEKGRLVCFEVGTEEKFSVWLDQFCAAGLVSESEPSALEFEHGSEGPAPAIGCVMKRALPGV